MNKYYKYLRTYHVPTSPGLQNDDRRVETMEPFYNQRVVVTLKCDGENVNCYNDYIHARSVNSGDHPSRHLMKQLHASIKHDIPEGWRICGENCYALHSIYYTELPSYFLVFGIYNEKNECLSWDETVEYCQLLGLTTVPVIYDGIYDEEKIQEAYENNFILGGWSPQKHIESFDYFRLLITEGHDLEKFAEQTEEGYVIRLANSFHYEDFYKSAAKFVRGSHVKTSDFWMLEKVIPNKLKGI